MSSKHRLFFALVPDQAVRNQVFEVQRLLGVDGRAVSPSKLHVTLAFLGMQDAAAIPRARAVAAGLSFEPCRVVLDHLGVFGRGSVLWLGAGTIPAVLHNFQQAMVAALTAAGIGHDPKPWKLHLTLYRRLRNSPPKLGPVVIEWQLRGFDLIESVGVKSGVEYHSIGHWETAGPADHRRSV